jgi:uncharacterized protein
MSRSLPFAILSPVLLVGICVIVQVVAGSAFGAWAWVPTMLVFWATIAFLLRTYAGIAQIKSRFRPAVGSVVWSLLAVAAGLLSLHGFIRHWALLSDWSLIAAWLVFAFVNPWFEESYWRGLLMDCTASWGRVLSLGYSSALFAVSHPLIWGVHSLPLRKPEAVGALFFVGLLWGLSYQRTGTLRWAVVGHMLANLFGLAALVLLNLYDPTLR